MNEKKFNGVLIAMAVISFLLSLFNFPLEGTAAGIVTIVLSCLKKEKYVVVSYFQQHKYGMGND